MSRSVGASTPKRQRLRGGGGRGGRPRGDLRGGRQQLRQHARAERHGMDGLARCDGRGSTTWVYVCCFGREDATADAGTTAATTATTASYHRPLRPTNRSSHAGGLCEYRTRPNAVRPASALCFTGCFTDVAEGQSLKPPVPSRGGTYRKCVYNNINKFVS